MLLRFMPTASFSSLPMRGSEKCLTISRPGGSQSMRAKFHHYIFQDFSKPESISYRYSGIPNKYFCTTGLHSPVSWFLSFKHYLKRWTNISEYLWDCNTITINFHISKGSKQSTNTDNDCRLAHESLLSTLTDKWASLPTELRRLAVVSGWAYNTSAPINADVCTEATGPAAQRHD